MAVVRELVAMGHMTPHGYPVVASFNMPPQSGFMDWRLVLVHRPGDQIPWVVWNQNVDDASCHNGGYHREFSAAWEEFNDRVARRNSWIEEHYNAPSHR